jgi:hypothetical protein
MTTTMVMAKKTKPTPQSISLRLPGRLPAQVQNKNAEIICGYADLTEQVKNNELCSEVVYDGRE